MRYNLCCFVFVLFLFSCSSRHGNGNSTSNKESQIRIDSLTIAKYNDAISFVRTSGYSSKDSVEKAIGLLKEVISLDSMYVLSYATIAHLYVVMGDVNEGICYMKKACDKQVRDGTMLCALAQYYDLVQKKDSARKYYQEALSAYEYHLKDFPDSIGLVVNKYFALSLMEDDAKLFTEFLREFQGRLPDTPFWKAFVEHYLENGFDKREYLGTLIQFKK
jgi:tetratricopeptide (TPR) repeat protein